MTVGRIFTKKYISLYLYLGLLFENRENSGLTPGQNDDPVTRTWKMTQTTHLPGDPMTQFHVCCLCCCCCCFYAMMLSRVLPSHPWFQPEVQPTKLGNERHHGIWVKHRRQYNKLGHNSNNKHLLRPVYRSTCVSRMHLQLRTGVFCWCKVLLPACPCWRQPAHSD